MEGWVAEFDKHQLSIFPHGFSWALYFLLVFPEILSSLFNNLFLFLDTLQSLSSGLSWARPHFTTTSPYFFAIMNALAWFPWNVSSSRVTWPWANLGEGSIDSDKALTHGLASLSWDAQASSFSSGAKHFPLHTFRPRAQMGVCVIFPCHIA